MSDDLAGRYSAGTTPAELAAELGVNVSTIHRRLRAAGVEPRGRADKARARTVLTDRRLRARLRAGASVTAIAREHSVDVRTVTERAAALGISTIVDDRMLEQARAAADLYRAGASLSEVGAQMGAHPRTVRTWLVRLGEPLRPVGRPPRDAAQTA